MVWKIELDRKAEKELIKIDNVNRKRILKFLDEKLRKVADPRKIGEPLEGKLKDLWRYRVGDYRLICKIEDDILVVLVVSIGHRREIYKKV